MEKITVKFASKMSSGILCCKLTAKLMFYLTFFTMFIAKVAVIMLIFIANNTCTHVASRLFCILFRFSYNVSETKKKKLHLGYKQ